LIRLEDDGLKAIGRVRDGRLGKAGLSDKKTFEKQERGSYEYVCDGNVCIVCWSDNNLVTCASNFDSVLPASTVRRRMAGKPDKCLCLNPA